MDNEFWLVWQPDGSQSPTFRHLSELAAIREAERLAAIVPGKPFYVLHAVTCSQHKSIHTVRLDSGQLPF